MKNFNRLLVHQPTFDAVRDGKSLAEIHRTWERDLKRFRSRREEFLLYSP